MMASKKTITLSRTDAAIIKLLIDKGGELNGLKIRNQLKGVIPWWMELYVTLNKMEEKGFIISSTHGTDSVRRYYTSTNKGASALSNTGVSVPMPWVTWVTWAFLILAIALLTLRLIN
jgi:DNA-binding PadR family transcriptional regulator